MIVREPYQNNEPSDNVDAIEALVRAGREKFVTIFPEEHQVFDWHFWFVKHLRDRATRHGTRRLNFTLYSDNTQPLPEAYSEVIKSWIILEGQSVGNMFVRLHAAQFLWEAILKRRSSEPRVFRWSTLSEEDLNQAELLMRERWAPSSTYKTAIYLNVLADFLAARNICRPLYYTVQTPRSEDFDRHTIAGQEARRAKLPSERALQGLADIYNAYATEPSDRLRAAAIAILVVTGFRIGELLTMPQDCEVKEERNGKSRYGLRYYKEKAKGGERMYDIRWLTAVGAELARRAIEEIRAITKGFRERARVRQCCGNP